MSFTSSGQTHLIHRFSFARHQLHPDSVWEGAESMATYSAANTAGPGGYYTFEVNIVRESEQSRRRDAIRRTAAVISAVSVAAVCVLALTSKPAPVSDTESSFGMADGISLALWTKDGSREHCQSSFLYSVRAEGNYSSVVRVCVDPGSKELTPASLCPAVVNDC